MNSTRLLPVVLASTSPFRRELLQRLGIPFSTVRAIQNALRKALNWNQALVSGKAATMTELARTEGVSPRQITHIIKLAYLAPDIMGDIIKGNIPATLSLKKLKKGIPLDWKEQRDQFGFSKVNLI